MFKSIFLPEAKPYLIALGCVTALSLIIASLCIIFINNPAGVLVSLILTSGLFAYIKAMHMNSHVFQNMKNQTTEPFLIFAYLGVFTPVICLAKAISVFPQESLWSLVYLFIAFVTYACVKYMCSIFIFIKLRQRFSIAKLEFDKKRIESDLNKAFDSIRDVFDSKIDEENTEIYKRALQSNNLKDQKQILIYFQSLKDADTKYRNITDA